MTYPEVEISIVFLTNINMPIDIQPLGYPFQIRGGGTGDGGMHTYIVRIL